MTLGLQGAPWERPSDGQRKQTSYSLPGMMRGALLRGRTVKGTGQEVRRLGFQSRSCLNQLDKQGEVTCASHPRCFGEINPQDCMNAEVPSTPRSVVLSFEIWFTSPHLLTEACPKYPHQK